jgi:phospholipase/lecithinase/hemolysin
MATVRISPPFTGKLIVACLVALLTVPVVAAAQSSFSGIVVFGTSLSDPGNAFVLTGDAGTPHDFLMNPLLIPSAPYAKGGHHFSNGATWIEQYARTVDLAGSVRPALAGEGPATNFAVGAARAYNDGINFNLTRQVDTFLERSAGVADPQSLYVIEMGSNDIRDAFQIYATGGNGGPILGQALGSIDANIQRLYLAGARSFLVWTAPNIALTPAIRSLPPAAQGLMSSLTQSFNANLSGVLAQLSAGLPGVSFTRLDAYGLLNAIVADPAASGLTSVTTACLTPNDAPFSCQHPDEYLFWDGIHPTQAAHALLAQLAASVLP